MKRIALPFILLWFAFSGYAAEFDTVAGRFDVYTSIRTYAMYQEVAKSDSYSYDGQVKLGLQSNSRAGIKWDFRDDLFAHFEVGLDSNNSTDVAFRLLYGGYRFDGGGKGTLKAVCFAHLNLPTE